jgi:signal transduction histidine kinase
MIEAPAATGAGSQRLADAHERAERRLHRQRGMLRPLGWAVILVVVAGAAGGQPHPGLHGKAIGVTFALCAFAGSVALAIRDRFSERSDGFQAAVISAMGAAGVALVALQPRGATELAGGAAVWMAVARLPLTLGVALATGITVALDLAAALSGTSANAVLAATLLAVLLALVAYFLKQSRASQDRTELLLAQLEDAREEQTRAAAIAERSRIAGELHDVLAHSLSGAAIQLQGARKLAEREEATPQMCTAIDRAGQLVREGLANAREAVGALRGDDLLGIAQLPSLVESFRVDMDMEVGLSIEGTPRTLPADTSLALYRGVQEALTNVARYAPGAAVSVVLRYESDHTTVSIEDRATPASASRSGGELAGVGGGRGLAGMRERIERAGGSMQAGPTASGWRVELDVPA